MPRAGRAGTPRGRYPAGGGGRRLIAVDVPGRPDVRSADAFSCDPCPPRAARREETVMDDLRAGHVAVLATRMLAQSALPDAPVVAVRTLQRLVEWGDI